MPTIEVTIGSLEERRKRDLATSIAQAIVSVGIPEQLITIIFRHIEAEDLALRGGGFPFWPERGDAMWPAFARAEITAGGLDDAQKRRIAMGIGTALIEAGVPEEAITVVFRPVDPRDVAVGRGRSPFD